MLQYFGDSIPSIYKITTDQTVFQSTADRNLLKGEQFEHIMKKPAQAVWTSYKKCIFC